MRRPIPITTTCTATTCGATRGRSSATGRLGRRDGHRHPDCGEPVRRAQLLLQAARLHAGRRGPARPTWTTSAPPAGLQVAGQVGISGYQGMSNGARRRSDRTTNIQGQTNITNVVGAHTLRAALTCARPAGTTGRTAVRRATSASTTPTPEPPMAPSSPPTTSGRAWPRSCSVSRPRSRRARHGRFPDQRVRRRVLPGSVARDAQPDANFGLRYEWETASRRRTARYLDGYDPNAAVAITDLAAGGLRSNPIPQARWPTSACLAARLCGPGHPDVGGQSMWMPRVGPGVQARRARPCQGRLRAVLRHAQRHGAAASTRTVTA